MYSLVLWALSFVDKIACINDDSTTEQKLNWNDLLHPLVNVV